MKVSRFAKITVSLNCAVPAILLIWDAFRGQLGANPVNFAIRTTGILSLIFLCFTLLVTPLSRISHQGWLGQFRRMLGLCAFYYAAAHFLIFFGFDRSARVGDTISEIFKRKYLMVGMIGLGLMVPLAVTSTDRMIRRIGGARWKQLHRLTFVVAIAGVLHFYMLVKADISRPVAFGVVVGLLLGYRFATHYWQLRLAARQLRLGDSAVVPSAVSVSGPRVWSGQLRVARIFQETPDVRTLRLVAVDSPHLPFDYLPGQYLNLSIQVDGNRVNRSYTIASSPTRQAYCEITVKREPMGVSSRHLHDTLVEGSLIDVKAPAGRFTFTGSEADAIVLIAGGVGITPLMSKIRHLTDSGWAGRIDLIFGVKEQGDIIFRDELEYLQRRFPNLRVTVTLSRDEDAEWRGERGRISADLLDRVVDRISERRVHVCGPVEMMDSTVAILKGLGVPESQIHLESFVRPARVEANGSASFDGLEPELQEFDEVIGEASVTFARSGKSKPMDSGQTILEASEELQINIPYDCRAGVCGQCKVKRLSGRVVMEVEDALDFSDRRSQIILSCQARCLGPVVIDA
jgi:ferredoxin-NADP reductase/DMSO/TMAO reductase YedYZ heme-binding membrane subunit